MERRPLFWGFPKPQVPGTLQIFLLKGFNAGVCLRRLGLFTGPPPPFWEDLKLKGIGPLGNPLDWRIMPGNPTDSD